MKAYFWDTYKKDYKWNRKDIDEILRKYKITYG